ncbi:hypothetical protein C8A05DRAFT_37372 [Staphylotrichum tortipilum]|uniref:Nucleosome assembly protein n=1 Tax=Staphylotrichum tortipilum TaxID=2831512 RepID=A0AAN6MF10_9PEZI|nr:hypothetical protein C8A05DRAFT_37372 [Staphylotrichum longicolle]
MASYEPRANRYHLLMSSSDDTPTPPALTDTNFPRLTLSPPPKYTTTATAPSMTPLSNPSKQPASSTPSAEGGLTSWSTAFLASKPQPVRDGVTRLLALQHAYTRLMMQYQEEAGALERKYQALARPLFEQRTAAIAGILNPSPSGSSRRGGGGRNGSGGIPEFWLAAMRNEPSLRDLIMPRDEEVLGLLRDIRVETSQGDGERGFALVFDFGAAAQNPWFDNTELRKTYVYARAADSPGGDGEDIYGSEYTYSAVRGDVVRWKAGMDLTVRDGGWDHEEGESFFAWFTAPERPVDEEDEEAMRRFEWLLELDFDYGEVFKDKVIPYAVHWYTGEATLYEEEDEEDDDDEDDDEEEDDDDEDDEDEEDEDEPPAYRVTRGRV